MFSLAPGTEDAVLGKNVYTDNMENSYGLDLIIKNTVGLLRRIKICLLA